MVAEEHDALSCEGGRLQSSPHSGQRWLENTPTELPPPSTMAHSYAMQFVLSLLFLLDTTQVILSERILCVGKDANTPSITICVNMNFTAFLGLSKPCESKPCSITSTNTYPSRLHRDTTDPTELRHRFAPPFHPSAPALHRHY